MLITAEGGKAFAEVADVADPTAIAPVLERCVQRLGGLDGLALNVGISHGLSLAGMTPRSGTWTSRSISAATCCSHSARSR